MCSLLSRVILFIIYGSYFPSRGHPVATVCFDSNRPTVWVEKSKTGFQDGGCGMILAIFYLHINLLLHCKFQLNSPCGLRGDVQNGFSIWRLWRPSWISDRHDHFDPEIVLLLQSKFWLKSTKGLRRDVET